MLCLYLQAPFGVFRTFMAGSFRPTASFITPSAAYGLLLNVAGIEMRRDDGKSPMTLTAQGLLDAWAELDLLRAQTLKEMSAYPVLLCPVASIPAFKHDQRAWIVEGKLLEYMDAWRHSQWFNALACPAAVVPVGRSLEGLPIGVQIVARPFEDEKVLGIAEAVDAAFGYRAPEMAKAAVSE